MTIEVSIPQPSPRVRVTSQPRLQQMLDLGEPHFQACVSIGDPGDPPLRGAESAFRHLLRLEFEDNAVAPSREHVERLVAFWQSTYGHTDGYQVHCLAGVHRSSAAALVLLYLETGNAALARDLLKVARPLPCPNRALIQAADEVLGTDLTTVSDELWTRTRGFLQGKITINGDDYLDELPGQFGTGLVLGKFAPFHRGHQHLLETALLECHHVIALVYQAKRTTEVPLAIRAGWLRDLYPEVEVLEAPDGPEDTGDAPENQHVQDGFLRRFLAGRTIDAFFSSEPYGADTSRTLHCVNRQVDPGRALIPLSGTQIRRDLAAHWQDVHPRVRADLVERHVLVGGPSTGKTTLARALADRTREPWVPEFGRDYWFRHQVDHRLTMTDLEVIAREQVLLEDDTALAARAHLWIDTSPLTTYVYALYWFGAVSGDLRLTLDHYLARPRRWWLCADDFLFEDTPDRSGPASRDQLQSLTRESLAAFGLSWRLASGTLEQRLLKVLS